MFLHRGKRGGVCWFGLIALVVLMFSATGCSWNRGETELSENTEDQSQADLHTIQWNGKEYIYNNQMKVILFMGIDKDEAFQDKYITGESGQADCIMLLALNTEAKEASIIQINRNTMTELDIYDLAGNKLDTTEGQLCLQYAYGIGGKNSCWAMKTTTSELLGGLSISGYLAMDMAGIQEINDALGGVEITMDRDYAHINPAFAEGATVHLMGDMAEQYVRYRDINEFGSVTNRMERQVDYVTAMIASMGAKGTSSLYDVLVPYLDTYIITDLDAEELDALTTYDYLCDKVEYLPGENVKGEIYEEYYMDEDAWMDMMMSLFYTEVN